MDLSSIIMWLGFMLAAYSVVGNDVIQTLGTFLTSNERRVPWYILWLFAASILCFVLIYGYLQGDIAYDRLDKFVLPETYQWYFLLPPIVLLTITRLGIPVSTTFMILTLFSLSGIPSDLNSMVNSVFSAEEELGGMIQKSIFGYIIAFFSATFIYLVISLLTEKYFIKNPIQANYIVAWMVLQWVATGFLWSQWLIQDLANIYIYLRGGFDLSGFGFAVSLLMLLLLLAYIFYSKGGAVQDVVRKKTNTTDIRSATFIDFIYGAVLFVFKDDYFGLWGGKLPMSTTWVFIGVLAGREIGMQIMLQKKVTKHTLKMVYRDLGKVFIGLMISIILVFVIKLLAT